MQRRRQLAFIGVIASVFFVGCSVVSGWSDLQEGGSSTTKRDAGSGGEEEEEGETPPGSSSRDASFDRRGVPPGSSPSPPLPDCKTVAAGDDCTCTDPADVCNRRCNDGACEWVAKIGVSGNFSCNGGGCEIWCESGSQCVTDCQGSGCIVHCAEGAMCVNKCENNCTYFCAPGACTNVCRSPCDERLP